MPGEMTLTVLLRQMGPALDAAPYGYGVLPVGAAVPAGLQAFAVIAEPEGLTVVATLAALEQAGIAYDGAWARISLGVQSDLAAVGLTAAIATALTAQGVSANVVAGYFHDHVFVQWDKRDTAMAALLSLAKGP
jgi:uncharacterized protein